jgi:drug/metabolite transporter (DMT)-like permease
VTHLAAILGVLIISFSAIFVRLSGVSADTSAFFRTLYALPALLLLWIGLGPRRRPWRLQGLSLIAGFLLGVDLAAWHRSIAWLGAGLATVLGNTQVIFVGLGAWLLQGERPARPMLVAAPVALLGITLVSGLGRSDAYGTDPVAGTLFGLLTGIAYAAFLLVFRRSSRPDESPFGAFFVCTIGALVATGTIGALGGDLDPAWTWPAHGWLIALALGSQVTGWLLIAYALPRLAALETSVLMLLQPMATVLWGRLVFAEDLSTVQWTGVALVLAGVGLPALASAVGNRVGGAGRRVHSR